jgi:hypothetical protein
MPPEPYSVDAAALKVLKSSYWEPGAWRTRSEPDQETIAALTAAGLWTGLVRQRVTHDDLVLSVRRVVERTSPADVSAAFVASLRTRRLDLRSALGSFGYARFMPAHRFRPCPGSRGLCRVCGTAEVVELEDPNLLNFERFSWGGVRHDQLEYCLFDLQQFSRAPRIAAAEDDVALLRLIVDTLRSLPPRTAAGRAAAALTMLPGNRDERRVFLGILAICGIVQTSRCPGFGEAFVPYEDRPQPETNDHPYPLWCWTAAAGVDDKNLTAVLKVER